MVHQDFRHGLMKIWDPLRRGAADISFVAPYTNALAGMDALGRGGHMPNESLQLDSMALAIKPLRSQCTGSQTRQIRNKADGFRRAMGNQNVAKAGVVLRPTFCVSG